MISSTQRSLTLLGVIAISATSIASAQISTLPAPKSPARSWEMAQHASAHRTLKIATIAGGEALAPCKVKSFTEAEITCNGPGHKSTIYARKDVRAILAVNKTSFDWGGFFLGGAANTGLGFAVWELTLAGPAGLVAAGALGLIAFMTTLFWLALANDRTEQTEVLYVAPGLTYRGATGELPKEPPSSETQPASPVQPLPSAS